MALVKPVVQVDLGLTAGFMDALSTVAWTDISDHVVSWSTSRGRQPRRPPAHFDPGQAELLLNNRDRIFDPTNTAGRYYPNLQPARVRLRIRANWPSILTPDESSFEGGLGGWANFFNSTVARSTVAAAHGSYSLRVTSIGAGDMTVISSLREVTPGTVLKALGSVRAGAGTPPAYVLIAWYDANRVLLSSVGGATITTNAAGFSQAVASGTAPANAAYAAVVASVTAAGAGEVAYWDCFSLHPGTGSTWIQPYAVFTGYVKRWPPEWTASATSTVKITAVDALGAPLNLPQMSGTPHATTVSRDRPKVWLRLGESSGTVAADSSPNLLDGQYQGTATMGTDSIVATDAGDKAYWPLSGSRVSLPYKNLIAAYPFSVVCWISAVADRARQRIILAAYDGPSNASRQYLQFYIESNGTPANAGKLVVLVANPWPTGSQIVSTITVDDGHPHHIAWVCESSTVWHLYIDGTDRTNMTAANAHAFPNDLVTGYGVGNTPAVAFGDFPLGSSTAAGVIDEFAVYDYAMIAFDVHRQYEAGGWPVGIGQTAAQRVGWLLDEAGWWTDRVVSFTASTLQFLTAAGGVVSNLQKVEDSEQGALFVDEWGQVIFHGRYTVLAAPYDTSQVSLGQGVGDLPYEAPLVWGNDDAEVYNQVSGSRVGGKQFTVVDVASQAAYGERPLGNVDGLWNMADGDVVDLLTYRVGELAQPANTVREVKLHPAAVPALYPYVLGLGLRSRVTVKARPPGGGPEFAQDSRLEHIDHAVDASGDWWTTWEVSAVDTAPYLILDDAARGVLDAGNRVAF